MRRILPSKRGTSFRTLPLIGLEKSRQELFQALDYVSERLCHKGQHITLIVIGNALSCLHFQQTLACTGISIIPASSPLPPSSMSVLAKAVHKAQKKFHLGIDWLNDQPGSKFENSPLKNQIIRQSLIQNEVIYSAEGITLLAVDYLFGLKKNLEMLAANSNSMRDLIDAVVFLRRLVLRYRGRPLSKALVRTGYPQIEVTDQALLRVNAVYEWKYGNRGMIGINDEFLGWRREGRVGLGIDLDIGGALFGDDDGRERVLREGEVQDEGIKMVTIEEEISPFPTRPRPSTIIDTNINTPPMSRYAIDYEVHSASSSRACSPCPISLAEVTEIENFLSTYNYSE